MWALFDWTHHGMLLGTARTFQTEYNKPITRAREKCATYGKWIQLLSTMGQSTCASSVRSTFLCQAALPVKAETCCCFILLIYSIVLNFTFV